jgi:endonuclease-3
MVMQLDLFFDKQSEKPTILTKEVIRLQQAAQYLVGKYKWVRKSPQSLSNTDKMLFLVASILGGGTNEMRAVLVSKQIRDVWTITEEELLTLAHKAQILYAPIKAKHAYQTIQLVKLKYQKQVPQDRKKLESLPGVARHVASVVMATLFDLPEFGVDLHVRRIMSRLKVQPTHSSAEISYEKAVTSVIDKDLLGHLSRAFVDFGQDICGAKPRCNLCSLDCPSRNVDNKSVASLERQTFTVKFVREVTTGELQAVSVRQGRLKCTCADYAQQFKCKHTQAVKETLLNTKEVPIE